MKVVIKPWGNHRGDRPLIPGGVWGVDGVCLRHEGTGVQTPTLSSFSQAPLDPPLGLDLDLLSSA